MNETVREIINKDNELTKRLEKILENHKCSKNYICLDKNYNELCEVCPLGTTPLLECLDPKNVSCKYLYATGNKSFCECEVRIFIQEMVSVDSR